MGLFKTIKHNARWALKGKWGTALGMGAVLAGLAMLLTGLETLALRLFVEPALASNPTMEEPFDLGRFTRELLRLSWVELSITALFVLMALLLLSPLRLGLTRWYLCLADGEPRAFRDLFYFFETSRRYLRAVWLHVQLSMRLFCWGIAFFFLPGGLLGISVWFLRTEGISAETRVASGVGIVLACGLLLLAAFSFLLFSNRYALAPYLLCESDDVTPRAALRSSIAFTKGHCGRLFLFELSFIGWYLLSPLSLFLILLYVVPYHIAASTLFARYLVEKNRLSGSGYTQEFRVAGN